MTADQMPEVPESPPIQAQILLNVQQLLLSQMMPAEFPILIKDAGRYDLQQNFYYPNLYEKNYTIPFCIFLSEIRPKFIIFFLNVSRETSKQRIFPFQSCADSFGTLA